MKPFSSKYHVFGLGQINFGVLVQNANEKICQLQLQEMEIKGVGFIESALQWFRVPFHQLTMEN